MADMGSQTERTEGHFLKFLRLSGEESSGKMKVRSF